MGLLTAIRKRKVLIAFYQTKERAREKRDIYWKMPSISPGGTPGEYRDHRKTTRVAPLT